MHSFAHFPTDPVEIMKELEMSRTIPIYKKDKKDDLSNFCPIGLINELMKNSFLNNNNFFKTNRFGFLPGRNVMQAITKLLNYIFSALNVNKSVLLVMLDISKAYNCIDYKILLKSLKTQESGATHYNGLNLSYAAGGKKSI